MLPAPEAIAEDSFGISMAADGDTLVVGAQFADAAGQDAGLAYVFERRDGRWRQAAVLSASDAEAGDQSGLTTSTSGGTIVVGARLKDHAGRDAGVAYVFERRDGAWRQAATLKASDPAQGDLFGRVCLDGDRMLLSADLNDDLGEAAGKAYAFERRAGTWVETAGITASDGATRDEIGLSLDQHAGVSVFGAIGGDSASEEDTGAAYVFEWQKDHWRQTARLTASDATSRAGFGSAVATHRV